MPEDKINRMRDAFLPLMWKDISEEDSEDIDVLYDFGKELKKAFARDNKAKADVVDRAERLQKLVHNSTMFKVLIDGRNIDGAALGKLLSQRPKELLAKNSKLKKSGGDFGVYYELTLPAFQGLVYDETAKDFKLATTCPFAGECTSWCFAGTGGYVQYENTALKQARMLNYLINDWSGFKQQLISEIQSLISAANPKKGSDVSKTVHIRWHDSGDFFSKDYLLMAYDVARQTQANVADGELGAIHYAYTKSISITRSSEDYRPKNFIMNFSEGGKESSTDENEKNIIDVGDKMSIVIPKELQEQADGGRFKNTQVHIKNLKQTSKYNNVMAELKQLVFDNYGQKWNFEIGDLLTYSELMREPYQHEAFYVSRAGKTKQEIKAEMDREVEEARAEYREPEFERAKHVIVMAGDGDDAATRPDVGITFLLMH